MIRGSERHDIKCERDSWTRVSNFVDESKIIRALDELIGFAQNSGNNTTSSCNYIKYYESKMSDYSCLPFEILDHTVFPQLSNQRQMI